jgi:hypothetical protein
VGRISTNRRALLLAGLLALLTLAAYWPARHYDFVDYDDDDYVFENNTVRAGLTWYGLEWAIVDRQANNWHPLTWVSHMIDCQLFGLNAGEHHLTSVIIHCTNAALLLLLLNYLTGSLWRSAFVAALFALHPLRVESVAWIAERKDVLSGFFFMLTLWMYARHVKSQPLPSRRFYRLALLFFLLGLLAKPMLVTVPLVLLLLDFWPLNRISLRDDSLAWKKTIRDLLVEKWPFFFLSLVFGVITLFAQRVNLPAQTGGMGGRLAGVVTDYLDYLEKLFWPHDLTFLYLRPSVIPVESLLLAVLALLAISVLVIVGVRRHPYLIVGWLWFLGMLLPVIGLVSLARLSIADRYTYLPSIGIFLLVTWGIAEWTGKFLPRRAGQILGAAGALATVSVCVLLTRQQLAFWQNTETLMTHALKLDPNNYVAQTNLRVYRFEKEHPGVREKIPGK